MGIMNPSKNLILPASFYDENNTTELVITAADEVTAYWGAGVTGLDEPGWTINPGGANVVIASVADGADSGVDIAVTTTGAHGLSVGWPITHTDLADAAYVGLFTVKAIISSTIYEVGAVFTATDTGVLGKSAFLQADAGTNGTYSLMLSMTVVSELNNHTFDFEVNRNSAHLPGSHARRSFGTGGSPGSVVIVIPHFTIVGGDVISITAANVGGTGNITFRHLSFCLSQV